MIGSTVGSVPSTRRNVRSATRGKGIERLVRQLCHAILVPIPSSSGAPEGKYATSLANEIGKEIRSSVLVRNCVNKAIKQSQPEVTSPMNEFEISIDVLGRRPGYLKGYGIHHRGSSSTMSITKSAERDTEVVALKETIAVQAEQITSQAEQMNTQAEQMNVQAQKTADLEALVHQLFARSQPGGSGGSRDFSLR
ncbi:uncharacterized protein A4U43_C08F23650 [Asparagus officinalis]|nr:uncharacterized protein A4U43_C08F23650 [Asparagus officinalis]